MIDSKIEEVTAEDLHDRNEAESIKKEDTEKADEILARIEKFLADNKEAGKKDDDEKTKLYAEAKGIWKELTDHINNIGFIFNLNDAEYNLIKKYIYNDCEYDHQSVFMGIQLKLDFFKRAEAHKKNNEPILVTCSETILMHHLFVNGGFRTKGLSEKAYHYTNILKSIGDINKIYNQLDVASKRAGDEINNWVHGLEPSAITNATSEA